MEHIEVLKDVARFTRVGLRQSDIARIMGVSRQRVGQLADKAEEAGFVVVRRQVRQETCPVCGAVHRRKNPYCSGACARVAKPPKFGGPSSTIEMEIFTCDGCGVKFSRTRRQTYLGKKLVERKGKGPLKRKFCTRECYHERKSKCRSRFGPG